MKLYYLTEVGVKINYFYCILLYVLSFSSLSAQDGNPINSVISSADRKKMEKADTYKDQAEKLIEEANQLYLETFNVRANYDLGEKEIEKRTTQLESKAQSTQFEAIELYKKSNEIKYTVYKTYVEKFWSENEGRENEFINARLIEEQSNDLFYQASVKRNEAEKIKDNKEKILKLNEAYDLEELAIEKQKTSLGYYYGSGTSASDMSETSSLDNDTEYRQPVTENETSTTSYNDTPVGEEYNPSGETTLPVTDPQVNMELINLYQKYLNDTTVYPDGFLTPEMISQINSFNADQILNLWQGYLYGMSEEDLASTDSSSEFEENLTETDEQVTQNTPEQPSIEKTGNKEEIVAEIHEGEEEKAKNLQADANIIYRVQVAANKSELSQQTLRKMFYGNKNVEMINENGWFKYSIGDFESFDSADKFRKSCGVKNAFIVAYRKGTIFEAPAESSSPEEMVRTGNTPVSSAVSNNDGLLFRVQVAANRVPMRKEQINAICSGTFAIEEVVEDGWYKYQVIGVRLFSDALKIISEVKVEYAFIVAYDNNIKTDLYGAVKRSAKIEKEIQVYGRRGKIRDTEYFVQVAASKRPLKPEELTKIYPGNLPVTIFFEDDWYKYRIKAGFDYSKANEIKIITGVEKSFVVAYNKAQKITLHQANE